MMLTPDSIPHLPRHVRLRFDKARGLWVLLAPERVLVPDETAVEVLQLCDGARSIAAIAGELAQKYDAPAEVIVQDVTGMLADLAGKGFLRDQRDR